MTTPEEQGAIERAENMKDCCRGTCSQAKLSRALLSLNEKLEAAKIQPATGTWRVGTKVPMNVYEGDRPVCQCHNEMDASRIVAAMNSLALAQISEPQPSNVCMRCHGKGKVYIVCLPTLEPDSRGEITMDARREIECPDCSGLQQGGNKP